ncbi:MAG: DUF6145 family protein [Lachnospiraceae bacterium]|nr:DUF6145 family protein [Lachnospiraceae bacterium]
MAVVVCGANSYNKKYYLNPAFDRLPPDVQQTLKLICVEFVEEAGGIFTIEFDLDGKPEFTVRAGEHDTVFSQTEADVKIQKLQEEEGELMEQLTYFYRIFVQGGGIDLDR